MGKSKEKMSGIGLHQKNSTGFLINIKRKVFFYINFFVKAVINVSIKEIVAVVTGSGRSVGRAEAMLLAQEGAKVVINDLGGTADRRGYV